MTIFTKTRYSITLVLLSLLLCCLVTPQLLANPIFDDFEYEIIGDTVTILRYCGDAEEVIIPDVIEGKPVTAIGAYTFWWDCSIQVTLPASLKEMGWGALCGTIGTIVVPEGMTSLGAGAFYSSAASEIILPQSLKEIDDQAFRYCLNLTSIVIPSGVVRIGNMAFYECESLQSITIPEGVTSIGTWAFAQCWDLQSISLPSSLTEVGTGLFFLNQNLIDIQVAFGSTLLKIEDGVMFSCDMEQLLYYPPAREGRSYIVPANVEHIADYAFNRNRYLEEILLPEDMQSIGEWAFSGCEKLQTITVPETVSTMGSNSFFNCQSLEEAVILASIRELPLSAFERCSSLQQVVLPPSLREIAETAFAWCSSLETLDIPQSVTGIANRAFASCDSLTSIILPEGLVRLGGVFMDCPSLVSISIPPKITVLDWGVLTRCDSLSTVRIPETVRVIRSNAFTDCPNLTIYGAPDSIAQDYSQSRHIPFVADDSLSMDIFKVHKSSAIGFHIGSTSLSVEGVGLQNPPIPPQIMGGRVMMPLDYLLHYILHGTMNYDEETGAIAIDLQGRFVHMVIGDPVINVRTNTEDLYFDYGQAPVVSGDYILVPLRAFEEVITAIKWDETSRIVTIIPYQHYPIIHYPL